MNKQLKKIYDKMDLKNEEILSKSLYCRDHNFNFEAEALNMQYNHGRSLLLEFRVYMRDLDA